MPLVFAPVEAFQFNWSEDWVVIGGERTKRQEAQFKLCHSRAFMLRAYRLQTHEMLFDAPKFDNLADLNEHRMVTYIIDFTIKIQSCQLLANERGPPWRGGTGRGLDHGERNVVGGGNDCGVLGRPCI